MHPEASATFPGYASVVEISSGPFASVYHAVEISTHRRVALEMLHVPAQLPYVTEAFAREVKALAALSSHPNIVTLYATVTTPDSRPVLVLELCSGSVADRLARSGPLPAPEVVSIGIKVAAALECAHRGGLLHGEVRPGNVLLTAFGEPALADFGVAALRGAGRPAGDVPGSAAVHTPPEILEGNDPSPQTDVYGLASTLYELAAGRAPFSAFEAESPASVALRILRDPAPPLTADGVPSALSEVLLRALSKVPGDRQASAGAMVVALRMIEDAGGWPPTPYTHWEGEPQLPPSTTVPTSTTVPAQGGSGPLVETDSTSRKLPPSRGPSVIQPVQPARNLVWPKVVAPRVMRNPYLPGPPVGRPTPKGVGRPVLLRSPERPQPPSEAPVPAPAAPGTPPSGDAKADQPEQEHNDGNPPEGVKSEPQAP